MWKDNGKTTIFPLFLDRDKCKMLPLDTKQSGGKLILYPDLQVGVFLEETLVAGVKVRKKNKRNRRDIATSSLECGM